MMNNNEILEKIFVGLNPDYKLLYATKMGSHLYGTNTPESDTDVKFIFLPSTDDCVLGIASSNINLNSSNDSQKNTKDDVDIQGWSLQFFVSLLKRGDTNAIDVLYSITNKDAWLFKHKCIDDLFNNSHKFYDVSNLRGLLGYIVSQAEKYSLKGNRFVVFQKIQKILDNKKPRLINDEFNSLKLFDIISDILHECQNSVYCKLETTVDDREAVRINGKVHLLDITLLEFEHRINSEMKRYGERTKQSLDGSDWKALMHAYRCILQAKELFLTGKISFPLKDAEQLRMIKMGQVSRDAVNILIEEGMIEIQSMIDSVKPSKVDVKYTNNFILDIYDKITRYK